MVQLSVRLSGHLRAGPRVLRRLQAPRDAQPVTVAPLKLVHAVLHLVLADASGAPSSRKRSPVVEDQQRADGDLQTLKTWKR